MALSDIQRKKVEHFFRVLDNNNNGILQPNDFTDVAKKICAILGNKEGSDEYELMIVHSYRIFIQIMTDLGKYEDIRISRMEWMNFFEFDLLADAENTTKISSYIVRTVYYLFNLFDANGDGQISLDEYTQMFEIYGIETSHSLFSFQKLDLNDDGYLSKVEMTQAFKEYFLSSDPEAPGNWIFGHWFY